MAAVAILISIWPPERLTPFPLDERQVVEALHRRAKVVQSEPFSNIAMSCKAKCMAIRGGASSPAEPYSLSRLGLVRRPTLSPSG
ncbi:MAG: hypothetical protein EBQ56_17835 [Proteobacteria bacterium]|nr:hypothetical protein [Pseudomonadota bacterium]NBT93726.1 hypothetical protein [Chloroflexota bacterium]NBT17538.1 hypothetical protein [Pseudomonadota bacterium]NBY49593.1 hypothetical protein [Pseudomonadota bacterium]NDB73091.1 hypothetical protein [Pseudomonadota bacterium]